MTDFQQEILALEELRRSFDAHGKSSDILDQKAGSLLNSASLVTGLFAALQISLLNQSQSLLYWIGLVVVLLAFLALIILCTSTFWPRNYRLPIRSDWQTISENLLTPPPTEALHRMISSYSEQIPFNRDQNRRKAQRVRGASFLLSLIVALFLLLSLLPR